MGIILARRNFTGSGRRCGYVHFKEYNYRNIIFKWIQNVFCYPKSNFSNVLLYHHLLQKFQQHYVMNIIMVWDVFYRMHCTLTRVHAQLFDTSIAVCRVYHRRVMARLSDFFPVYFWHTLLCLPACYTSHPSFSRLLYNFWYQTFWLSISQDLISEY